MCSEGIAHYIYQVTGDIGLYLSGRRLHRNEVAMFGPQHKFAATQEAHVWLTHQ